MDIPEKYSFLLQQGTLPRVIQSGLPLLGVAEVVGKGSNATILSWRDELNKAGHKIEGFSDDDVPWCGLYTAIVTYRAGKEPVANPLWARNWTKFGNKVAHAALGDVLVFVRQTGGHVGFYIGEDATHYHVLGGNQSNAVTITRIEKNRCIGMRRAPMTVPPKSIRPYYLAASGLVSYDEA